MDYTQRLIQEAQRKGSIICLGMDPLLEEIPLKEQSPEKRIVKFYTEILQATKQSISAVKPNYAFFAQYGFPGLRALKKVISLAKSERLPAILDAKRGDIGKSSEAYAREAYEFWKVDAVTISPYMGKDSVQPFIDYCAKGKGAYILARTSNKGAEDFQEMQTQGGKLYMEVAKKVAEWHKEGVGAVAGATSTEELEKIAKYFAKSGKSVPLLIPGVGAQGASARAAAEALRRAGADLRMHRINSSNAISFAYKIKGTDDYAGAAAEEVNRLNAEISLQ